MWIHGRKPPSDQMAPPDTYIKVDHITLTNFLVVLIGVGENMSSLTDVRE